MSGGGIETSHGREYIVGPRLSDVTDGNGGTDERRRRNHDGTGRFAKGNDAARGRGPKRAILGSVQDLIEKTAGGTLKPSEATEMAQGALKLYDATRENLGDDDPRVLGPALRFAVNTMLAGIFTRKAGEVGFTSKRGMALLELAHKCEGRADRSSVQATTLAEKLAAARRARSPHDPHARVLEAFGSPSPSGEQNASQGQPRPSNGGHR